MQLHGCNNTKGRDRKIVIEKLRTGEEEGGGDETVELCVALGGGGGGG